MYQPVSAYVCVYFVTISSAWAHGTGSQPERVLHFTTEDIQRGLAAEKYLLEGAEMAFYESERMILYKKQGIINNAVSDFRYLNPVNVQVRKGKESGVMKGAVGNRDLALYIGQSLYPQITLTMFVLDKDSKYQAYTKGFWYIGSSKRSPNR